MEIMRSTLSRGYRVRDRVALPKPPVSHTNVFVLFVYSAPTVRALWTSHVLDEIVSDSPFWVSR